MTEDAIRALVVKWQERLDLRHWRIEVNLKQPARPDCYASTWRSHDYDRATLYLDPGWPGWTKPFAEHQVVHELLHLVLRDIDIVVDQARRRLSSDTSALVEDIYDHALEGAVSRLAGVFAPEGVP